jgi:hypothetical protein
MVNKIRAAGDRMLSAFLPKTTAQAYTCWVNHVSSSVCHSGNETCCNYPEQGGLTRCWCI